jgi:glycosyltransferase involved in cell wall biosynthesis
VDPWVQLLSVAALTPGKGHGVLVRALRQIPRTGWHLTCVGSLERDAGTTSRVRDEVREGGLERHLSFVGELTGPALAAAYHGADVFVHPTLSETFGMVVAEALARGLPVVSTTTGAIPDLVGGDAGLLVAPGDEQAFADALSRIVTDAGLRGRLAEGARRVRDRLPTWEAAVAAFAAALRRFESDDAAPR